MKIQYASMSKDGGRDVNEDAIAVRVLDDTAIFVLADGLGGHGLGEIASSIAVKNMLEAFDNGGSPEDMLTRGVFSAYAAIIGEQRKRNCPNGIKTTLLALVIKGETARWLHIGDSRLYWFVSGKLGGRTLDHSVPQMLFNQGEIKEKEIRFHEDRNRLTRALGMEWDSPKFTLSDELTLTHKVSFLLCSDGFWELIDEKEMSRSLKRRTDVDSWLEDMAGTVLENGRRSGKRMDNYSAIAVELC